MHFAGTGLRVTTDGRPYLGSPIGSKSWCDDFIATKVNEWVREVELLATAAILEPHCAYSAFFHGTNGGLTLPVQHHAQQSSFNLWKMLFPVPFFQPSLDSLNFYGSNGNCFHFLQNREALGFHILRHLQHTNEPHLLWSLLDWPRPSLLSKASIAKMEKR